MSLNTKQLSEPAGAEQAAGPTTGPIDLPGTQLRSAVLEHDWLPRLPKRLAWFEPAFLALAAQYVSDLGGERELTAGRKILLRETLVAWINVTRQGRSLQVRGVGKRNGEPSPMLASYYTGLNTLRLNLLALGLQRRSRRMDSYVSEVLERQRGDGHASGPGNDDQGPAKGEGAAEGPALSGPGVPAAGEAPAAVSPPGRLVNSFGDEVEG